MNSLSVLFWDRFHLPIFWGNCSNLQLMRILLTIWISDCLCLAHIASQNQDEFTVSFISRQKFIFLFFEEAVWIWRLCKFSFSFGLQLWCAGSIYKKVFISGSKFLSHEWRQLLELAVVLLLLTILMLDGFVLAGQSRHMHAHIIGNSLFWLARVHPIRKM